MDFFPIIKIDQQFHNPQWPTIPIKFPFEIQKVMKIHERTQPPTSPHDIYGVHQTLWWLLVLGFANSNEPWPKMLLDGTLNLIRYPTMIMLPWCKWLWTTSNYLHNKRSELIVCLHSRRKLPSTFLIIFMSGGDERGWLGPRFPIDCLNIGSANPFYHKFPSM